ncbi:MAG: hypothetical protein ACRCXB_23485 [Aeromonadaceae bacterium]
MPKLVPVIATSLLDGSKHCYKSMTHAAREGGFERSCIHDVLCGFRPSHAGFTFKLAPGATTDTRNEVNQYHRIANALNEGNTKEQVAALLGIKMKTITSKMAVIRRMGLLTTGATA